MRICKVLAAGAAALMVLSSAVFAQGVGAKANIATSGPAIITPNGTIVIPDEPISLTQDPIVITHTFRFFGMAITYIDTTIYWTNGNLCSKSLAIEIRNQKGQLITSTTRTRRYDGSGKLMSPINISTVCYSYNRSGALTSEAYRSFSYDTNNKPLSSHKAIISYTYTAIGEIATWTNRSYFYDGLGKQVSSSLNVYIYSYNADGTMNRETCIYEERGADNEIRAYSRNTTDYYYLENGDSYTIRSSYDIDGKLCVKSANLILAGAGEDSDYYVLYVIGENGEITYTRVYDSHHTEASELGGAGYIAPVAIIDAIRNPAQQDELLIQVEGDLYLNSNKTWDFSATTINVTGSLNIVPEPNGYDIYVDGDMTMTSGGDINLKGLRIYISGDLTVTADALLADSGTLLYVGGTININSAFLSDPENITIETDNTPSSFITIGESTSIIIPTTATIGVDTGLADRLAIQGSTVTFPKGVSRAGFMANGGGAAISIKAEKLQ